MSWDFTRYQCKRISYNKLGAWLPCCSNILFHEAKEQLAKRLHRNRRAPRRTYGLLYFLPCTLETSECHKECSYSAGCRQQLRSWSTIAMLARSCKTWVQQCWPSSSQSSQPSSPEILTPIQLIFHFHQSCCHTGCLRQSPELSWWAFLKGLKVLWFPE